MLSLESVYAPAFQLALDMLKVGCLTLCSRSLPVRWYINAGSAACASMLCGQSLGFVMPAQFLYYKLMVYIEALLDSLTCWVMGVVRSTVRPPLVTCCRNRKQVDACTGYAV